MNHRRIIPPLAILLALHPSVVALSYADEPAMEVAARDSSHTPEAANPAYMWVVRRAGVWLASWAAGQVVDWAADRAGVTRALHEALDNLAGLENDRSIPSDIRVELRRLRNDYTQYHTLLTRNNRSDAQVRRDLQALRTDFHSYIRQTNATLIRLDRRISAIEVEQRRHLKLIADLDGRVGYLENRLVDVEGRVTDLDGRLRRVEDRVAVIEGDVEDMRGIVYPDSDRFLRHEAYLGGALAYANSPSLGRDASIGATLTAQYNFNQFFGVFADFGYLPLAASDAAGMPSGSSVTWDNVNLDLGATVSLLPPRSPVSFQLGAGGGIASSVLMYYEPGEDQSVEGSGQEMGRMSNVYMLVKGELGVAPPAYTFEPVVSVGYMTFMDDVAYADDQIASNAGRSMWYVSLGVRVRQYLRSGERIGAIDR